jgi:WD40 repeat protein
MKAPMNFCPSCGVPLKPGDLFCAGCGQRCELSPAVQPPAAPEAPRAETPAQTSVARESDTAIDAALAGAAPSAIGGRSRRRWWVPVLIIVLLLGGLGVPLVFYGDEIFDAMGGGGGPQTVTALAFAPNRAQLVAGTDRGDVLVFNTADGRRLSRTSGRPYPTRSVAMSHAGTRVALGYDSGVISLRQVGSSAELGTLNVSSTVGSEGQVGKPLCLSFQPQDYALLGFDADTLGVRFWQLDNGSQYRPVWVSLSGVTITAAALSANHSGLVLGDSNGILSFWSLSGQQAQRQSVLRNVHSGPVRSVAVSPNHQWIASAGPRADGKTGVSLWSTTQSRRPQMLTTAVAVTSVAWSADSRLIAGGGKEFVTVWRVGDGREVFTVKVD